MIRMVNVSKTYDSDGVMTEALRGISLEIHDGEYVAVMGASGSGKSTLLNIIGGMDSVTGGEYYYNDLKVHEMSHSKLHIFRRDFVSFVFQNFELMKYYTVAENVEMPLLSKRMSSAQRKKTVKESLELLGISELAKKCPSHISGGQQQRCAIARALCSGNELLLADEPTGSLDQNTGNGIMDIFDRLNEMGRTVILITHDPNVAARAKRVIKISDGQIVD